MFVQPGRPLPGRQPVAALGLDQMLEVLEFGRIGIGDRPQGEPGPRPMQDLIALALCQPERRPPDSGGGPDEWVDDVLAVLVDERRDRGEPERRDPDQLVWTLDVRRG